LTCVERPIVVEQLIRKVGEQYKTHYKNQLLFFIWVLRGSV